MRKDDGPQADGEEPTEPEICDLCGAVIPADSIDWSALVPDSSAIHTVESNFDGRRMLVACSQEHLEELIEQYKHRPFVDVELWAGKIARVLRRQRPRPDHRAGERSTVRDGCGSACQGRA
ncbi:hypothetical protein ACWEWG_40710 [Streptomyces sp. NPDC003758]